MSSLSAKVKTSSLFAIEKIKQLNLNKLVKFQ